MLEPERITERIYKKYKYTHYEKDWIYGVWYCGTSFQKAEYYGQFPPTFIDRVLAGFPIDDLKVLHLCCGKCNIEDAVNVDIMFLPEADVCADGERLPFADSVFDMCLLDPPYSEEDSTRYGVKRLIRPKKTMEEIYRCLVPGGWLLWLDEKYPSYFRKNWKLHGLIAIVTGFERRTRILSMFRKHGKHEFIHIPRSKQLRLMEDGNVYATTGKDN